MQPDPGLEPAADSRRRVGRSLWARNNGGNSIRRTAWSSGHVLAQKRGEPCGTMPAGQSSQAISPLRTRGITGETVSSPRSRWLLLSHPLADFELHLAGFFVSVDHDVIPVENFSIENLQGEGILNQLLDRPLQRTRAEVRIVPLREQQFFRAIGQFERDLALGEQATYVFQPQLDDLHQLLLAQRTEDDDVIDAVQELWLEVRMELVHYLLGDVFEPGFVLGSARFARGTDECVRPHVICACVV